MSTKTGAYHLGIDLGTTYAAAAVARQDGRVEVVSLGNRSAAIPSVIYLRDDDTILTGEAAERRAATEPGRIAREFKRRIGDPTPLLLGGSPYSAEALASKQLRWIVDKVAELEGGPADQLAVTHPANWGPYKQDLLRQAIRLADLPAAVTLTEPQAAAISYAANERVEVGSLIAVYDLGGGTFDAAVLRKTEDGFDILGEPEGIERLGGIDLDEAVFAHVRRALGAAMDGLDVDDPTTISALARLRQECVDTKEALSADTEASIPVLLPNLQTEVRLTRGEFEQLVRPPLSDTVAAMRRALASAGAEPHEVSSVLLVGGSSRIPLVAELVSDAFGRPIAVDAHPKHAIALGAAHAAALEAAQAPAHRDRDHLLVPVAVAAPAVGSELAPTAPAGAAPVGADLAMAAAPPAVTTPPAAERLRGDGGGTAQSTASAPATTTLETARQQGPATTEHERSPSTASGFQGAGGAGSVPTTDPDRRRSRGPMIAAALAAVVVLGGVAAWALGGSAADGPVVAGADATDPDPSGPADPAPPSEDSDGPTAEAGDDHAAHSDESDMGGDTVATTEAESDEASMATQEVEATGGTTEVPPGVDFVTLDVIALDGATYVVDFTTYEFEAQLPGPHVHFFFDTVPPDQAGVPGAGPWFVYGGGSPFTGYGTADRPAGAERLCVLAANPDHSVQPDSGNCIDLP